MQLPSVSDLDVAGKNVFLRLDLNAPMEGGKILSDARLVAALPVLRDLLARDAKVAVASHLGRPGGRRKRSESLLPVAQRLSELLGLDVLLCDDCIGDGVRGVLQSMRKGQVACLENLRFHPGEEANDAAFARALAGPFDVYVNDAFGAAHRAHASTAGIVPLLRARAVGPLVEGEIRALSRLRESPSRPFVIAVGGAKVSDKIGFLSALVGVADTILIGGAMAYTFLVAQGTSVGSSMVEPGKTYAVRELMKRAELHKTQLVLPVDHVVARQMKASADAVIQPDPAIAAEWVGLDIGPATRARFAEHIRGAGTVFWNGPMGVSAWPAFAAGTEAVCEAVARCPGYTVVGGGDSIAAVEHSRRQDAINFVSTGGGASLAFLESGKLAGLSAFDVRG